jgi:hypothetical protein
VTRKKLKLLRIRRAEKLTDGFSIYFYAEFRMDRIDDGQYLSWPESIVFCIEA